MLILGLEQSIDLGDKVFQVERLGQELGLGRGAAALERDRGKAGDEHDADRGIDRAGPRGTPGGSFMWACSSVVEHCVDIAGVASSILATPTIYYRIKSIT